MADWVWEVNEHGVYTYSSAKGQEIFGDVIRKPPLSLRAAQRSNGVKDILKNTVMKRPIKQLELG